MLKRKQISPFYNAKKDEFQEKCNRAFAEKYGAYARALGFKANPIPHPRVRITLVEPHWCYTDGVAFSLEYPTIGCRYSEAVFEFGEWVLIQTYNNVASVHTADIHVNE